MENEYDVDFRKVKPKFTPEEFEETARMIRNRTYGRTYKPLITSRVVY